MIGTTRESALSAGRQPMPSTDTVIPLDRNDARIVAERMPTLSAGRR
jgi:hypothetical protein